MKLLLLVVMFFLVSFTLPHSSLFNLSSVWEDHNGEKHNFSEIRNDKYKIITMIFTSCPAACPLMVSHVKKLDMSLSKEQKEKVEYLFFSIDPLDKKETLAAFHKKFSLDARFIFFRNKNEASILELAAVLGFKYKKIEKNLYSHGTDVYLLNPEGEIIKQVKESFNAIELGKKIP